MTNPVIDGKQLYALLSNGYRNLRLNMDAIDELNVFPVPDGDTGKNMTTTLEGGVSGTDSEQTSAQALMKDFSYNTLLAARGNSGVILSQFVRGIAEGMSGKDILTIDDFLSAIKGGVSRAYEAVVNPVEGTMLTVMREAAENAIRQRADIKDFGTCLEIIIAEAKKSLMHTPELLPVLKEAGVVDSGGAGLVCIFEGMLMFLNDETLPLEDFSYHEARTGFLPYDAENLLEFGYCTEFILQLQSSKTDLAAFDINKMIAHLETLGNSIVAVNEGTIVKVHIHSFEPENVIGYARSFGELITIKIENMSVQHSQIEASGHHVPEHTRYAVVAVAAGQGIIDYFKGAGVNEIVDGGQTNNPSAEAFIETFKKLNADHIIVLPNDSNIVMTAHLAADMYKDTDVRVIETRSIAEGYSVLSMMDLTLDTIEDVIAEMTCYLPNVTTGYVTTATRDAVINGITITKNDYIGLTDDNILSDSSDKVEASLSLLYSLPDIDDKQVITVFYGKDVTEEESALLRNTLLSRYPLLEVGLIDGSQEIYSFIFAIE